MRDRRVTYTDLPVGAYTFQVKAVDRDLTYFEAPATVAVDVYYQPASSTCYLTDVLHEDLFASFYASYARQPFGTVTVVNDAPDSITATLRYFLPDFMRRPTEQPLRLPPHSSQVVDLQSRLESSLLDVRETVQTEAEVELSFDVGEQTFAMRQSPELTVHGRGALRWDQVTRAAAFITSDDPTVAAFARPPLVAFEAQIKSLGMPGQNLLRAMVLFEALKQHGIRYLADANTPYAQSREDQLAIDHIQYPAQTLQSKTGDCDDLTALYCALLENAGVATALVDYPGHIFLLFDSGIAQGDAYQLPLGEKRYLVRGGKLWIPLEITLLDQSFLQAWQIGTEELAKLSGFEQRRRIVDTAEAWQQYPAAAPSFEVQVTAPESSRLEVGVADQYDGLKVQIDQYIDAHYLDPLQQTPDNDALRLKLIQLYCALRQYDTAIHTATDYLLEEVGDKAATYNQLGVAYYLKGEMTQAALQFKQAVALRPEDKELQRNLDRALQKLGKVKLSVPETASSVTAGEAKGATEAVDIDDFYWLE